MRTASSVIFAFFLTLAFGCSDTDTPEDETTVADTRSDSRVRPDGSESDTGSDSAVDDQGTDQTPDTAGDTGTDAVEDTSEDVTDQGEDTTEDTTEDTGTDSESDGDLGVDAPIDDTDGIDDTDEDPTDAADTTDTTDTTDATDAADATDTGDITGGALPATPGDLVIIEVQGNPQNLDDENAEYLELYNRRDHPVQLSGVTIAYAQWTSGGIGPAISSSTWPLVTDSVVPAKGRALLVRTDHTGKNGGLTPDATYGGTVISNGASTDSRIRLLVSEYSDETSGLIDEMVFPGDTFGNDLRGRSLQFDTLTVPDPTAADNENSEYLCYTPANDARKYSEGNWGSPGTANFACP